MKSKVEIYPSQKDYPDPPEGEEAVLVCMPAGRSKFTDNVFASCSECGIAIMHRPHVPKGCKLMCHRCAMAGMERAKASGEEIRLHVTEKTKQEVVDALKEQP